ncbi:bifunctional protein-serine/threonine kinase/phosphatase [Methylobacterium nodulans]|uniref:Serine/threonine protein kinase n=1 Tax=Methylobacterium nodulans (strain LMG 21967 / CNCM I-2342 / ORS 2060) TaxID=460265 RepID=B8IWP0_METNO|nr:bifunctional protein-serine/threonine kinase/phosphatase [Methylobacterium nodulans]ACL62931.1 serine/threonine protein kinase [Methylobacterium nodulans ORS 2060]
MRSVLSVSIGQYSSAGRKAANQDFHGALIPDGAMLAAKGIAVALADGISTSRVSHVAAETAVKSLLTDYYCTSDAWSVKTSVRRVLNATNSWLHAETKRGQHAYDLDKGYICTLSALVLKGRRAHLFHVGDCRVFRLSRGTLEQLTEDHRVILSSQESYLGRALGMAPHVEIDYQAFDLDEGDIFILATDGVYQHAAPGFMARAVQDAGDKLDAAARRIAEEAFARGSPDNLTVQAVRIDSLPDWDASAFAGFSQTLPAPPLLEARAVLDGYTILRPLHHSHRSHLYLASDDASGSLVALKIPSVDLRDDPAYLQRFMMEEWIARRLDSPYVAKAPAQDRRRTQLYTVIEYVDGQTLAQWMTDHPEPDLETVRRIVEQIAAGLHAFHRREMVHQDLRPENIMIDRHGTVKIVDFGSTRVLGVEEAQPLPHTDEGLGTLQYAAPEYFVGEVGTPSSDLFSLGVIGYQMMTGRLPYGVEVARARTHKQQKRLTYIPAENLPDWIDGALRKAVHPDPFRRYRALSEFLYDLRHPNPAFLGRGRIPLYERNPLLVWQALCFFLVLIIVCLLTVHSR